ETGRTRAPSWKNEVTLRSIEMFTEYEPGAYLPFISPTPLLMVVALGDHLTVADEALAAYERALAPKRLATLKGGHFDAYVADFDAASEAAAGWFTEHLL
ncbi:MAG TPA: alpha/beta hydrolase, partial [Acetobacteraceae bacterium]|nr:alpha/beta hydrolase [Acetobacteraceae bacterium]